MSVWNWEHLLASTRILCKVLDDACVKARISNEYFQFCKKALAAKHDIYHHKIKSFSDILEKNS